MALSKKQINIIESGGWNVTEYDDGTADISKYTGAGEDFFFTIETDDAAHNVFDYYMNLDPDEHALALVDAIGAPSIRDLLDDADAICEDLRKLAFALRG